MSCRWQSFESSVCRPYRGSQRNVQIDTFTGTKIGNTERLVKFRQLARQFIGEQEILIREQTFSSRCVCSLSKVSFASAMPMCRTRRFSSGSLPAIQFKGLIFANFTPPYLVPVLPRRSVQMRFPALPYADGLNPPQNAPSAFPPGRC